MIALVALSLVAASEPAPQDGNQVDAAISRYERVKELTGNVRIVGSSTVSGLLARMSEPFRTEYPAVKFDVKGGGSATAVPALLDGTADIAAMSRPMSATEKSEFQAKFGYAPIEIAVGLDAIGVFVNKDNPITSLTVADVAGLFSDGSKGSPTAKTWGDVGLAGEWQGRKVVAFGFRPDSGGSSIMKESVLAGANFRDDLKVQPGATGIVNGVGAEPGGVGYASQFYRSRATKMVPLAASKGAAAIEASRESVLDGSYPLGRRLYVYLNRKSGTAVPPATLEFIRFALSRNGQEVIAKEGNLPLPAGVVAEGRAKLG